MKVKQEFEVKDSLSFQHNLFKRKLGILVSLGISILEGD